MAISECDACGNIRPGSRGESCGCEGFFCHVCRGDELDPYGELEIDCAMCDGAGCHLCSGFGTQWVDAKPVTLDDLDERDEDESEQSKARTAEAMRMLDETIAMIRQVVEAP